MWGGGGEGKALLVGSGVIGPSSLLGSKVEDLLNIEL